MLPVVPKVHVGDVLYATRNLRNWLQTASLMHSVKHIRGGGSRRGSAGTLYTPNKRDKYIVCANAGLVFGVFVAEKNLILFFINADGSRDKPVEKYSGMPSPAVSSAFDTKAVKPHPSRYRKKKKALGVGPDNPRMSPTLFSTWFVHTTEKRPDLRQWPDYAYATWASLQMNAISINGDYRLAVQIPRNYDYLFYHHLYPDGLGSFGTGKRSKDRGTVRACLQYAIKIGMTRERHQTGHFRSLLMGHASGPRMEDLREFRKDIRGWIKNPRTRKKMEEELAETVIKDFLEGLDKVE